MAAGVTVVVAAGNCGKDALGNEIHGRIGSPGIEPSVITVGAANFKDTDSRGDDLVASFSSGGPTRGTLSNSLGQRVADNTIKRDLLAPGNKLVGAAAPVVAGAVALMLQAGG